MNDMNGVPKIPLSEYFYDLPDHRIANFPISPRDHSKLLVFSEGHMTDDYFYNVDQFIEPGCTIVANKVRTQRYKRLFFLLPSQLPLKYYP